MRIYKDPTGNIFRLLETPDGILTNGEYMINALEQIFRDYKNLIDGEDAMDLTIEAFNNVYDEV